MPSGGPVVVNLPAGPDAAGYRASLSSLFNFAVHDYGSSVTVDLAEGSGSTSDYFTATRLCGEGDTLWAPGEYCATCAG